ncbi:putative regulator of chromosome condensation 1/beta-lactamase-inhibitor protein II [Arabidopsis thaliana]|jgi:alpha-tubulin suppressor-like RCC1 family protein
MAEHGETQADEEEEEQVWSWGAGTDGQLGTTKLQDELLPQLLSLTSLPSISMLACGGAHVIALTSGGKVFTWGRGSSGQLGHGDILNITLPKLVSFFDDSVITQAAAGWSHSGFVSDSGCIFTCGNGSFGQLGHGDTLSLSTPAKVSHFNNDSVKMVACGMRHSLVLFAGNQVCGFGSGKRGQLGFSSDRIKSVNLPCVVSGLKDVEVVRISANGDHSAAISADGQFFSWGRGFCGGPDVHAPQSLPSPLSFREVAVGWNHALLLTVDGEVFKLGSTLNKQPEKQQLQIDSSEALFEKVPDFDGVKVMQIAAGAEHSAAVTGKRGGAILLFLSSLHSANIKQTTFECLAENGEVKTWGWGEHGQLGLGNTNDQTSPELVSLGSIDLRTKEIKVYCGSGFTYAVKRKQELSPTSS